MSTRPISKALSVTLVAIVAGSLCAGGQAAVGAPAIGAPGSGRDDRPKVVHRRKPVPPTASRPRRLLTTEATLRRLRGVMRRYVADRDGCGGQRFSLTLLRNGVLRMVCSGAGVGAVKVKVNVHDLGKVGGDGVLPSERRKVRDADGA